MGLMKLSGDLYNYEEDAKIAAMGVQSLDANKVAPNNLADKQPAQVDASVQPVQATVKQPAPNVPAAPIAAPEQDIYMPNQKSLPPLPPNTRYASYDEGSNMSRLKHLLKLAMTQEDLDTGYYDIPAEYEETVPTIEGNAELQHYTVPDDYSNYMAATPNFGGSPGTSDYSELPADQYTDADLEQAYMAAEDDFYPEQSMSYSPYAQGGYESMGYDPYQAYANYEQMYASPSLGGEGEYQDMQVQAPEPQVDPAQQAYQQGYDEIYSYLVQMGYSPEEAAAAAPSLLEQVNVAPPQPQQKQASYNQEVNYPRMTTKTASVVFNSKANELKASYVEAGYSPYQATKMSMEVVVPEAEKYASLAGRVIGGSIGALSGGYAGASRYDDEDSSGGMIAGALLGGGLGGFTGGRLPAYLGNNILKAVKGGAHTRAMKDKILAEQLAKAKEIGYSKAKGKDLKEIARSALGSKADTADLGKLRAELKRHNRTGERFQDILAIENAVAAKNWKKVRELTRSMRLEGAQQEIGKDLKLLGGATLGAAPLAYFGDRAMSQAGKDNLVDSSIDALSDAPGKAQGALEYSGILDTLSSGGNATLNIIKNNPVLAASLATGAVATPYLADYIRSKKAPTKGGRSKKAHIENAINKQASWKAHVGRTLGGALTGTAAQMGMDYSVMPEYVKADDELFSQGMRAAALRGVLGGAVIGGLGGVGGGALANRLGKSVNIGANVAAGTGLMLGAGASAIPALLHNKNFVGEHSKSKRTFWDDFKGRNLKEGLREDTSIEKSRMERQREQYLEDEAELRKQREKEKRVYVSPEDLAERQEYDKYKAEEAAKAEKRKKEEEAEAKRRDGQTWYENIGEDIKNDPIRAALIAGGTGAGLYGLYNLATSGPAESTNERLLRQYQQQQLRNKYRR